ncbi:hypothetical protein R1sor_002904 [Riccia sorocarpa]|uniref:Uncharacterized protein n=1 Tax=Riccia sorocarpa TaxID=122646 RepID=A0ABD3H2S2_9MARC
MESDVPPTVKPQDVLDKLMYDGTFDRSKSSLITALKSNDDLKNFILTLVENSEVLRKEDVERKSRRQLMEELRNELSVKVLEKASAAAWQLMLSDEGLGMEITEKVNETFCDLTGSSTLGCDCHPGAGPSVKKLASLGSGSSEVLNSKTDCKQSTVGSKRAREEEVEKPSSYLRPDSAADDVAHSEGVVVKKELEPASCNGSSPQPPVQPNVPKGNGDLSIGSSDTINDAPRIFSPGEVKDEERDKDNCSPEREQPSTAERLSESSRTDSFEDNSTPRRSKVV